MSYFVTKNRTYFFNIIDFKKRTRQDLSVAHTLNASLLQKVAEMRNDESALIHIRERDCVAIEAKYHKNCYKNTPKAYKI